MPEVSKNQFVNGLIWKTFNLFLTKGINIILTIILTRILDPMHFGLMTVWIVIINVGGVLAIGGLDVALVQKKDIDNEDFSTARVVALGRAAILCLAVNLIAPLFSNFYQTELLVLLVRVASIDFFFQAFTIVSIAKASREIDFKKLFIADFVSTIIGGLGVIFMFYTNRLDWILITNVIVHRIAYAIMLYFLDEKTHYFKYNKDKHKPITRRGYKAMANNLFDLIAGSATGLFLGMKWSATEVGYYNRAEKITQTVGLETYNMISGILLPTFASYQQDREKLKSVARKITTLSCYIMFPVMCFLALSGRLIVLALLTDKWLPIVFLLQLSCVKFAMNPLRQISMHLNYSVGMYKRNMQIESCRMILILLSIVVLAILHLPQLYIISIAAAVIAIIITVLYLLSLRNAIGYSIIELVKDLVPIIILTAAPMIPTVIFLRTSTANILNLIIAFILYCGVYIGLSALLKVEVYRYARTSLKGFIQRRK
ncbi:MAG: oligosaccharide flippase family protein [Clostridiales bacterium]|nr:oligosaccharide flippase family protein [Clostridiales bacterium]